MIEFLNNNVNIGEIVAFISGGGLLTLITARAAKRQADAHAMKTVQEVYRSTIEDMRADNQYLRDQIVELQLVVSQNTQDISKLKSYNDLLESSKCVVQNCSNRKKN